MPITTTLPWLMPGALVSLAVSIVASGALGRWLGLRRSIAWVLLFSLGVILSSTLSPLDGERLVEGTAPICDVSRTWPASLSDVTDGEDVAVNILMFLPLGCAIAIAPASRRKMLVLLGAIALPFAIEAVQLSVSELDRACQTADVVDNLTGLAIGLMGGVVVAWLAPVLRRPPDPEGAAEPAG